MKALIVRENECKKLICNIEETECPKCKDNEVLIEIKKVGICGSDFHLFKESGFSGPKKFPQIIGHEFSGIIVDTGKNVTGFTKGDTVASESVVSCEKCENCSQTLNLNCKNADLIGFTKPGAFAQYICIDFRYVHKINTIIKKFGEDLGFKIGAILEPLGCAYKSIFLINKNHDFDNKNFLVLGAGPIGMGAAWLLSTLTKANIYLIDESPSRLNMAKNINCTKINTKLSEDFFKTNSLPKVDFIFETTGYHFDFDKIIPQLFNSGGTLIYIARNAVHANVSMDTFVSNDFTMIGSRGHRGAFEPLIEIIEKNDISALLDTVEKDEVELKDLPTCLTDSENSKKGKIIVKLQ